MLESLTFGLLLEEAIKTGLGTLVSAGLERPAKDLLERLSGGEAKKHSQRLEQAYQAAAQAFGAGEAVGRLLRHEPFRREVLTRLLDPASAVDVDAIAAQWSDDLPPQRRALQNFFARLEDALLRDPYWGEIIERYQNLRAGKEAQSALRAHGMPVTEREVVTQVFNTWNVDTRGGPAIQGDVHTAGGDFVGRDKNEQTVNGGVGVQNSTIGTVNITQQAPDPRQREAEQAERLRRQYLTALARHCRVIPLAAMGAEVASGEDLTLDKVYIRLDTTAQVDLTDEENGKRRKDRPFEREDTRPLSAWEAAVQTRRLALLGDPGSGKSTFVRNLLACQADGLLGNAERVFDDLLPVLVQLRSLVARLRPLAEQRLPAERQTEAMVAAVRQQALDDLAHWDVAGFAPQLWEALQEGRCLLALDGLDEVPFDLRPLARLAVGALLERLHPERVIVTCRIRSYEGESVLPAFGAFTLAPFDREKIGDFCRAWYQAQYGLGRVVKDEAGQKGAALAEAANGDALRELASNPLMLTTMAIIHQKEIGLPSQRVRLYDLAVDVLLSRWQQRKFGETQVSEGLAAFLRDERRRRKTMERLAYEAHCAGCGKQGAADLPRGQALILLEKPEHLGRIELAQEFLDYVDQRAGLLIGLGGEPGRPAAYSFPHRTFQEYLAGCAMIGQRSPQREYYSRAGEGVDWSLAAQLGAEELYTNRKDTCGLLDLAYSLCPEWPAQDERDRRCVLWSAQMAALVGREEIERDTERPDGGGRYLQRLIPRLVTLLGEGLPAQERAQAGDALARLGDPRFRADAWYLPDEPLLGFVKIPAGKFWMGSDKRKDSDALSHEQPQHEVHLPEYWLGRYPVTVAQFRAFVTESGFKPGDPDCLRGLPNHPVVWVSWHEALAYCDWLTGRLRSWPGAPAALRERLAAGWRVLLPGEAEWEKAARGVDGRIYPWGEVFDAEKANTEETGVGGTSAVGCFPGGAGPYGLLDMSGNVWEWTRSLWGKDLGKPEYVYPYGQRLAERENLKAGDNVLRVLRGGAFYFVSWLARCACRHGSYPTSRYGNFGFRVAFLPAPVGADSEL